MPKSEKQTRVVSTVKTIWRRKENGFKTTLKWAAEHPEAVYEDHEHVEQLEVVP